MLKTPDPSRFIVKKKRCLHCPFSANQTIVSEKRLKNIQTDLANSGRPFVCHETIDTKRLVCRGFYDTAPNLVVHLAQSMGIVEFDDHDADE